MSGPAHTPGSPRSAAAADQLARFDKAMQVPLVLAAVLPVLLWLANRRTPLGAVIIVASWIVFVVDFVVRVRLLDRYPRTRRGKFDFAVVVLTGPWILFPALQSSGLILLARFVRVIRVLFVTKHARRLVEQLGRAFVVGVAIVFVCADIAYHAERATNPEFKNYADSLWWAVVTICTVGYGDITPHTATGRWAGVVLMVTGIGIIGALAGSLAGFLRLAPPGTGAGRQPAAAEPAPLPDLTVDDIATLRAQLGALDSRLERLQNPPAQSRESPGGVEPTA